MTAEILPNDPDAKEPALKLANDNPWYCLATLHGEQPFDRLDQALAEKNCSAWQEWFSDVPEGHRQKLVGDFAKRVGGRRLMPPERTANADFSHTRFDRVVALSGFQFFGPSSNFCSSIFCADVDFSRAQFHSVDFASTIFSAASNFRSTGFHGSVDFRSTMFSGEVSFQSAHFSNSNFHNAKFARVADFSGATFSVDAELRSATFSGAADFRSVKFSCAVDFGATVFVEDIDFSKTRFFDIANFGAVAFSKSVHFNNANFEGRTSFSAARFERRVPDFRGATMHEATEWHDVVWPKPPGTNADAQEQVYAYERLKQEMERLKKHEDEQKFFRRELRARRALLPTFSGSRLLNLIYQLSSNYGDNFSLPLLWLMGVFVAGIGIYTTVPLCAGQPMPIKLAARLSFANIFVFLNDKRELMASPDMASCLTNWTAAVSAVQSISGVVLLFLLGLVLRNRFRMK